MFWSPCCLRNLHPLSSVPLPSNLINVPAHRRKRRGCGCVVERTMIRFWRTTHHRVSFFNCRACRLRNVQFVHTLNLISPIGVPRHNDSAWTISNDATMQNLMARSVELVWFLLTISTSRLIALQIISYIHYLLFALSNLIKFNKLLKRSY